MEDESIRGYKREEDLWFRKFLMHKLLENTLGSCHSLFPLVLNSGVCLLLAFFRAKVLGCLGCS